MFHPGGSHRPSLLCAFHGKIGAGGILWWQTPICVRRHDQATAAPKIPAAIRASNEPAWVLVEHPERMWFHTQKILLFVLVRTIEHNSANVRSPPLISCKPRLKTFFWHSGFPSGPWLFVPAISSYRAQPWSHRASHVKVQRRALVYHFLGGVDCKVGGVTSLTPEMTGQRRTSSDTSIIQPLPVRFLLLIAFFIAVVMVGMFFPTTFAACYGNISTPLYPPLSFPYHCDCSEKVKPLLFQNNTSLWRLHLR